MDRFLRIEGRVQPLSVRYSFDPDAFARVQKIMTPLGIRAMVVGPLLLAVMQLALGGLALTRHDGLAFFGYVQIAIGVAYVPLVLYVYRRMKLFVPATDSRITIDDTGLTLEPAGIAIPWHRIVTVRDVGEAFVFSRHTGQSIALFTSDLPEHGRVLWTDLEERLIAKSYLVRGTSSRTTITNTRSA